MIERAPCRPTITRIFRHNAPLVTEVPAPVITNAIPLASTPKNLIFLGAAGVSDCGYARLWIFYGVEMGRASAPPCPRTLSLPRSCDHNDRLY